MVSAFSGSRPPTVGKTSAKAHCRSGIGSTSSAKTHSRSGTRATRSGNADGCSGTHSSRSTNPHVPSRIQTSHSANVLGCSGTHSSHSASAHCCSGTQTARSTPAGDLSGSKTSNPAMENGCSGTKPSGVTNTHSRFETHAKKATHAEDPSPLPPILLSFLISSPSLVITHIRVLLPLISAHPDHRSRSRRSQIEPCVCPTHQTSVSAATQTAPPICYAIRASEPHTGSCP